MNTADKNPKQVKANPVRRASLALYRVRRRIATGLGVVLVLFLAYHVVFGRNGVNNYEQKREQDRQLHTQIENLQQQNGQMQDHNDRLKNDPDAIEFEAREKLHYAKPGEVIYTLDGKPEAATGDAPASGSK